MNSSTPNFRRAFFSLLLCCALVVLIAPILVWAQGSEAGTDAAAFKGIPVRYTNPAKGFVSLAICRANGQIVRTLLAKVAREAGPQTEMWDGLDDDGKPVPPGQYSLKALSHPGLKPKFVASVMNSGNPPWGSGLGTQGWGADHGAPIGASSDADGNTYLLWNVNESGDALIKVNAAGQKLWGLDASSNNLAAVLYDGGSLYVANNSHDAEEPKHSEIVIYDAATGRRKAFPDGRERIPVSDWEKGVSKTLRETGTLGERMRGGRYTAADLNADLVAFAASPDRLFCSLYLSNHILAFDKKTFKVAETYDVPRPTGLAYDAKRKVLYAVSNQSVVTLDPAAGGVAKPFITTGLEFPYGLALDSSGNVYVSTRGKQMQVLVFDAAGKLLHKIGKDGGRPWVGKYDSQGMLMPAGLSIDAKGALWVTEADLIPKRISRWDAQSGKLLGEYFGASAYSAQMTADPQKPEDVYTQNMRWIVDYDTGKVRPDSTVYRSGWMESQIPGPDLHGFNSNTFQISYVGGRKLAFDGWGGVYDASGDIFKPLYYLGHSSKGLPYQLAYDGYNRVLWRDANGDGQYSPDELQVLGFTPEEQMRRGGHGDYNIAAFGGNFWDDGTFMSFRRLYRPTGFDAKGVPLYPSPADAELILQHGAPTADKEGVGPFRWTAAWYDMWPSFESRKTPRDFWNEYYVLAAHHDKEDYYKSIGEDGVYKINRNGDTLWRYSRVAIGFGLTAPLAKPGDLFGAVRLIGVADLPAQNGGEIVGVGDYRGYYGLINEDGLFVDQIGYDSGRAPSPDFDTFFAENFSGYLFRHPRTGKLYLFGGDSDARILEIQGWDKIRRFDAGQLNLTPELFRAALNNRGSGGGSTRQSSIGVAQLTPSLDGALAGWEKTGLATIALDETHQAKVRLSYDSKNLYALFKVPDATPWQNASPDWRFAFKGGDAVDLQLGIVNPDEGNRKTQRGDVRVLIAPQPGGKDCVAVAMWPRVPEGMKAEPQLYQSPTGQETFERVAQLTDVKCTVQRKADEYVLAAAIPWDDLGIKAPEKFSQLQGDAGVLLSEGSGTRTVLRRYLFNQETGIVNDIPNEVRLVSNNWGTLTFGEAGATVAGSESNGKAELVWAGTVGNSGSADAKLVKSTISRMGGGVVVDANGRIFTGGGDRILTLDKNGGLLWETKMPSPDWVLGGPTFATDGKYLYFIAGKPVAREGGYNLSFLPWALVQPNLCRVEMAAGKTPEVLVSFAWFKWLDPFHNRYVNVTSAPGSSKVYLGYTLGAPENPDEGFNVYEIVPDAATEDARMKLLFKTPPGNNFGEGRVSVDEDGNFYLSASHMVRKVDRNGQPVAGFTPTEYPSLGPVPSSYFGTAMLTKGAYWEMGGYGFVGRYTRDFKAAPGVVIQWAHNISYIAQIADGPDGTLYIKGTDTLYQAKMQNDNLVLLKRFGSAPEILDVAVSSNGYIGLGGATNAGMMWFDYASQDPAAVPLRSEMEGPMGQGYSDAEGNAYSYGHQGMARDMVPAPTDFSFIQYHAEPFNFARNVANVLATGKYDGQLSAVTRIGDFYFALDSTHNRIVRATIAKPCELTAVEGLNLPTDEVLSSLCALGSDRLLIAGSDGVSCFSIAADGSAKVLWHTAKFGDGAQQRFGRELYVASSGSQLLVSDTKRQRVLLFSISEKADEAPQFQAQFGVTDVAGSSSRNLNAPTLVSIYGGKAAVYDSANQRVVKLRIR